MRSVVPAGVLRIVVRVPAQRPAAGRADASGSSTRPTCTSPTCTPTTSTSRGSPITSTATRPCWCPATRPASWSAGSARLGFDNIVRTTDGEELDLGADLRIAIHVETSITDGPGGDSALVVSDGTARLVNQNDCRTDDLDALRAHGPVDLHWLQYSGAIWYPMVYDEPPRRMRELVDAKVDSQFARAMRYVEAVGATRRRAERRAAGVPRSRAVPPQRDHRRRAEHLPRPAQLPRVGSRPPAIAACWPSPARRSTSPTGAITVTHPIADDDGRGDLRRQGRVPAPATRPTGCRGSPSMHRSWHPPTHRPVGAR